MNEPTQAAPGRAGSLLHLPTSQQPPVKQGRRPRRLPANVTDLRHHHQARPTPATPATPATAVPGSLDELTRDVHALAGHMLRMVQLQRHGAGLPPLPTA